MYQCTVEPLYVDTSPAVPISEVVLYTKATELS